MKVGAFLFLLCRTLLEQFADGEVVTQDLQYPWSITNQNRSIKVSGSAPGEIYTALWKTGYIGDPRYRYNDVAFRWVSYDNWTYTMMIDVSDDVLTKSVKYLEFKGIDAVSKIYLNGKHIGNTSSAFIEYRFDVRHVLTKSTNLTVVFMSPVIYAKEQWSNYPYLVPPSCNPDTYRGECHYNFIRTIAANFAWDWGPAFPTMGFWRPVKIVAFNAGQILGTKYSTSQNSDGSWSLAVDVNIESSVQQTLCISVRVTELPQEVSRCWQFSQAKSEMKTIKVADKINYVELWWPNGYGAQKLYSCDVVLSVNNRSIDSKTDNIGFRTIRLVQEPVGSNLPGLTFYFVVNNVKIFIKGSNWVPLDNFLPNLRTDKYQYFLKSAQAANMNMLRVFGGGLYEYDWLYNWADKYGILIWQDMMFACAMYPTNPEFMNNVRTEIYQQIWRLQHHPSIALWSGSNENELAVGTGWYNAGSMNPLYVRDFRTLYMDVVKQTIYDVDPDRVFVMSSPTNGLQSLRDGGVSANPGDPLYGDVHFYTYAGDLWNANTYPISRFTSEFGFQSLPSLATWLTATNLTEDVVADGALMNFREHHGSGIFQIFNITLTYFRPPVTASNPFMNYTFWAYLTQANQAMIYRTHVEMLRRHQCSLDSKGQGLTMGAMYWMINDIWQAPTWASVENTGRWKMLHYFAKRFFSDSVISPYLDGNTLTVHLSFTPKTTDNVRVSGTVRTECFKFSSLAPTGAFQTTVNEVLNCPVTQVYSMDVGEVMENCSCVDKSNCFAIFSFIDHENVTVAENWLLFGPPKQIDITSMGAANLKVSSVQKTGGLFKISLTIGRPDLFVWLEALNSTGWFSDNGFLMYEKTKTVTFKPSNGAQIPINEFAEKLNLFSLSDLYLS